MKDDIAAEKIYSFTREGTVNISNKKKNTKRKRRASISDNLISSELLNKIVRKMYERVEDIYEIRQSELVEKLLPLNLSYKTIARIVNEMCNDAHATEASIKTLVAYKKKKSAMLDNLLKDLDIEV